MPVFKNEGNGTWYVMARYVNWKGERKQKCKRGFATKREAQEWERKFQLQNSADPAHCGRIPAGRCRKAVELFPERNHTANK